MTIRSIVYGSRYIMEDDIHESEWTDEMIEGLVEEECPQDFIEKYCISCGTQRCDRTKEYLNGCPYYNAYMCIKQNNDMEEEMSLDKAGQITDFEYEGLECTLPEGYIFKDENGNVINATKIVLEKKKKEYPTTIEECCEILGLEFNPFYTGVKRQVNYKDGLLHNLKCLLIYRDAYWKIAGEEMGLGKPWKPDWKSSKNKYTITLEEDEWCFTATVAVNCILAFPTEEMRDAFYENFKEEIEQCKELL